MAQKVPMRLKYLRVNPKSAQKNISPCAEELTAMLTCWRLNGVDSASCVKLVKALAICSSRATASPKANLQPSINFVLNRTLNIK